VVVFAGEFDDSYADNWGWNLHYGGLMVVLNMDGETAPYFEYGHNSKLLVKTGDRVKRGQVIALTGNTDGGTGISTGPHCHVGCLPYNFNLGTSTYGRVNPRLFMTDYPDTLGSLSYASESVHILEDDMAVSPSFEPNVRASLQVISDTIGPLDRDLRAAFDTVTEFQRDVRATFDVVRAQNDAQAATIGQLVSLLAEREGLDAQAIITAVTDAIAERVKITATLDGGEAK
jgi:hypothetical protein